MSVGTIEILSAGAFTTVQDAGRIGFADMGMLTAGAMDPLSMHAANLLIGNEPDEAVLECTLQGPEIRFTAACAFAVSGADMQPELDGQKIRNNTAYSAKAGGVLKLKTAVRGMRAYIAVKGGLDIPVVFGSRSTDVKCHIGGVEGRKLAAGDVIGLRAPEAELTDRYKRYLTQKEEEKYLPHLNEMTARTVVSGRNASPEALVDMGDKTVPVTLRFLWGPQVDRFPEEARKTFTESTYRLSADSDRMGSRLTGPEIRALNGTDIVSDGIVSGAVQVTSAGQPIVMTADHQTTGGYAKIAAVITADLAKLAQLTPGQEVRFVSVGWEEAVKAAKLQKKRLRQMKRAVN